MKGKVFTGLVVFEEGGKSGSYHFLIQGSLSNKNFWVENLM